jgi:aminocarboxymuconate-semialdehyde decarboxylase
MLESRTGEERRMVENCVVVDVHTHLLPALEQMASIPGVAIVDGALEIDGHRLGIAALYDAQRLCDHLRQQGVDVAWVSPPPPAYRPGLSPADAELWVRGLNTGMRARVDGHPQLQVLSYLPLEHPAIAARIALEDADSDASVGWTASAGGASVRLDGAQFQPLWRTIEHSGRPLFLHPGESPDPRLKPHYLGNLLGNPVETGVAVAQLMIGGVLARHPELRIVLAHGGGVVPTLIGRWSRGVETERPGIPAGTEDPRESLRSIWADCVLHDPAVLDLALHTLGADRLVLGSDYPFPMGLDDPFDSIAHLEPTLRDRIARNGALIAARSTS